MANQALILIKPSIWMGEQGCSKFMDYYELCHPNTLRIIKQGKLYADVMNQKIDRHYKKHSKNALYFEKDDVSMKARELFKQKFGLEWDECIVEGSGPDYPVEQWRELENKNESIKLEDGLYVARVSDNKFVVNGFYASMRKQYLRPPPYCTRYFVVEFNCDYSAFKERIIGATDPSKAEDKSMRGFLYRCWKALDLERQPSIGENCIHGSGSAEEAQEEIENFLGFVIY